MTTPAVGAQARGSERPWFREVTGDQWRAFLAAYLGWMLDGFDFSIVTFLLVDIQRSFTVNSALAGALGTVALMFRVVGGVGAGTASDRWGRKGPLMFSIIWYSLFAFASGFSTSYGMLFACRALFGVGMGGVWAAGMPLAIEHSPSRQRGRVSGLLQGGYAMGVILAAIVYQFVYPLVSQREDGWRVLLWLGILPALLAFWIMSWVKESPVWLERQRHLRDTGDHETLSFARLFNRELLPITVHTTLLMGSLLFLYNSITWWYPTLLGQIGRRPLGFQVAFQGGAIVGALACGRLSETSLGRRGAASLATLIGLAAIPLYVFTTNTLLLGVGAATMGFFGTGNFGIVPGYLNERFPTGSRAAGAGFAYQAGAALASVAPTFIGTVHDRGMAWAPAMAICIGASGVLVIILFWLGPETRGREFRAADDVPPAQGPGRAVSNGFAARAGALPGGPGPISPISPPPG
jgi:SHS family lactate transporter-like MFS transporter